MTANGPARHGTRCPLCLFVEIQRKLPSASRTDDFDPKRSSNGSVRTMLSPVDVQRKPSWVVMGDQPTDRRCGLVAVPQAAVIAGCQAINRPFSRLSW